MAIKQYSTTVDNNTAIDGTPVSDAGMFPNHVPPAIRKLMADLKEYDDNYEDAVAVLTVTANGSTAYNFDSHYSGGNPGLYATAGTTIAFDLSALAGSHPFQIETSNGTAYNTGLVHIADDGTVSSGAAAQGKTSGLLYWRIPGSISGEYAYKCTSHASMTGKIYINTYGTLAVTTLDGTTNVVAALTAGTNVSIAADGTISSTDTNTTYTADGNYGMTLSGTAFRLENDRRRNATDEDVHSGNTHDYTFYDAAHGIRWYTSGSEKMLLENDGDLHVTGNVTAYSTTVSDPRLKTDIEQVTDALSKVERLTGYTFTYKHDGSHSAGVISTEVADVLPSAIKQSTLPLVTDHDNETLYDIVQYDQLHALLIEAVKELSARVKELENDTAK